MGPLFQIFSKRLSINITASDMSMEISIHFDSINKLDDSSEINIGE